MAMPIYEEFPFLEVEIIEGEDSLNESKLVQEGKLKMSVTGKLFLAGLSAWIVGRASRLRIRGTKREIKAIAGALRSSKRFQDELKRPGATVGSVMEKLKVKNLRGKEFERVLGVPWPL